MSAAEAQYATPPPRSEQICRAAKRAKSALRSASSIRLRVELVLAHVDGIAGEKRVELSSSSILAGRGLRWSSTALRELARLGTINAAACVPGTTTVCSSRAVKMSSISRSAIRGALGRIKVTSRRRPALRIWAELVEELEHGRVLHSRAQDPFQRRMDLREQTPQAVADPCGSTGEVVVEADDHLHLGDGLFPEVDRAERVARPSPASTGEAAARG